MWWTDGARFICSKRWGGGRQPQPRPAGPRPQAAMDSLSLSPSIARSRFDMKYKANPARRRDYDRRAARVRPGLAAPLAASGLLDQQQRAGMHLISSSHPPSWCARPGTRPPDRYQPGDRRQATGDGAEAGRASCRRIFSTSPAIYIDHPSSPSRASSLPRPRRLEKSSDVRPATLLGPLVIRVYTTCTRSHGRRSI